MATACFWGRPALISVRMFLETAALDLLLTSGIGGASKLLLGVALIGGGTEACHDLRQVGSGTTLRGSRRGLLRQARLCLWGTGSGLLLLSLLLL